MQQAAPTAHMTPSEPLPAQTVIESPTPVITPVSITPANSPVTVESAAAPEHVEAEITPYVDEPVQPSV
ncbi:hypothetical protein ABTD90_20310, partial [Acinetobacter baumannii]